MNIVSLDPKFWHASASGHTHARGCVFLPDGTMLSDAALADYLDSATDAAAWHDRVKDLNGLFSAVRTCADFSAAAVDPSRSYPLFFRKADGEILIADTLDALLRDGDKISDEAALEYDRTGAPLDGKTLVEGISQVRPGTVLLADGSEKTFYTYLARPDEIVTRTDDELMAVMERIIGRLLKSVGDRQIVMPLSGGQDSRLIACTLKKLGAKNVVCYTAGRPRNEEITISERVAKQLGFELHDIDTTTPEAMALIGTADPEFLSYVDYVGQGVNFTWVFEYVAISLLRKRGIIAPDAVFVPGRSADSNSGTQLRKCLVGRNDSVSSMTTKYLYDSFEYGHKGLRKTVLNTFRKDIEAGYESWTVFQNYMFSNWMPYNLLNSCRAYAFFGYDHRLPFWDREFMEFFRCIDYSQICDCSFYINFVRNKVFAPMGVDFGPDAKPKSTYIIGALRKRIKVFIPKRFHPASPLDPMAEFELTRGMADELGGLYPRLKANIVMKDWYLARLREKLKK